MKKRFHIITLFSLLLFTACQSTKNITSEINNSDQTQSQSIQNIETESVSTITEEPETPLNDNKITLLFAGDIMAHSVNYNISSYNKIWKDIIPLIEPSELAFANIEAPIDDTKETSSYPNFNMSRDYIQAAIDAGFNVFSLCNNHTNDQYLTGIKETMKSTEVLTKTALDNGNQIYFSGLKNGEKAELSYNLIKKDEWTILFLPITELLNRPDSSDYINFIKPDEAHREAFISHVKQLREKNPCDLFILSVHTSEPEYTRNITKKQNKFYMDLLDAGVDILWANHAHIIKDRKYIYNSKTQSHKLIMYANGNTISGQRTAPKLEEKNPIGERDNTGDGLMVMLTLEKQKDNPPKIIESKNLFITTYINTAGEFVVKPLNHNFVEYLRDIPRKTWANYIERRITINEDYTKDLIIWQ